MGRLLRFTNGRGHRESCAHQGSGAVTEPSGLWRYAYFYLADRADEQLPPADYAKAVLKLHDVLVRHADDPEDALTFLLFHLPSQRVSKQHLALALKLLPKLPLRKRGRPKGALGREAYAERYQLYKIWIGEKARRPSLTKKQFVMELLGITDEDLNGEYAEDNNLKIDAVLQELKPARIKRLAEGERNALEAIVPLIATADQCLAKEWLEAKRLSPALTKEDFLRKHFRWPGSATKSDPYFAEVIEDYLEKLARGEKELAENERLAGVKRRGAHLTARKGSTVDPRVNIVPSNGLRRSHKRRRT
jgi:hypothetical protein